MPPPRETYVPIEEQRPKSVETSFKLWMAQIALGVLGAILTFVVIDDLIRQAADEAGVSADAAMDAARPVITTSIVIGLAIIAILAWLAIQMRNGKNWARITLTVLATLGVLLSLLNIGDTFAVDNALATLVGVIGLVRLALTIAAVVFMYMKDANPFFANRQNQY